MMYSFRFNVMLESGLKTLMQIKAKDLDTARREALSEAERKFAIQEIVDETGSHVFKRKAHEKGVD